MPQLTKVDQEFLRIPRRFLADFNTEFGFDAVIFGGAIRDSLLGFEPKDVDIILPNRMLSQKQTQDEIVSWIRKNPLTVNNSVEVLDGKNGYPGNIINASFKGPMKDIKIQLMSEGNFPIYEYLDQNQEVATNAVLIPQSSCNRISSDARANLFCEDEYMQNLEEGNLGIAHQVCADPLRTVKRLIRFSATRGLSLDYTAIEYINSVVPWGKRGNDFFEEAVKEAQSAKSILSNGSSKDFDLYAFTSYLYDSLRRKK